MGRRVKVEEDMGAAISLEDALSIMVVIFVLFVILFVPLIQLDRMNLEKATTDPFFAKIFHFVGKQKLGSGEQEKELRKYYDHFDIEGKSNLYSTKNSDIAFIESIAVDSTVTVIIHNRKKNIYTVLESPQLSKTLSYRYGRIQWDQQEKSWYTLNDQVAYGDNPVLKEATMLYEKWVLKHRGITKPKKTVNQ